MLDHRQMDFVAPPIKNERTTLERLEKFISDKYFVDNNLRGRLYENEIILSPIYRLVFDNRRISFSDAVKYFEEASEVVTPGFVFGPTWTTEWFRFIVKIPANWIGRRVHLVWDSECEAMLWSSDGTPLTGLSSEVNRTDFCISDKNETTFNNIDDENGTTFYVEAAGNGLFGAGKNGFINAPDLNKHFTLKTAKLAIYREDVYQLLMDFDVLYGLSKHLHCEDHHRYESLYLANHVINEFVKDSSAQSIGRLHDAISRHFNKNNWINGHQFTVHAVANSHIDTAWLWPFAETRRKCARSWLNALNLMEEYPQLNFACSQAQQIDWLKHDYPSLFERIRKKAIEGRFLPVGGCWIEMDGNLPSGESIVRQMLYGQQFFLENFGRRCDVFWLPDTFGYCPQLPQISVQASMSRFVTQKLSWNLVNKFPHHTFWWRGLDGTRLLTHFPPADSYNTQIFVEEFLKNLTNFRDKGRSKHCLMLYGHGDGGGGPDRNMLERFKRLQPLSLRPSTPATFFEHVEKENESGVTNLCTWDGELYLELHNGTYTTQARIKRANREMEFLLRDVEFLSVLDFLLRENLVRPTENTFRKFAVEWKKVLLNQFHDVLPGTSIGMVYEDAHKLFDDVRQECHNFLSDGDVCNKTDNYWALNSLPWNRHYICNNRIVSLPPMSAVSLSTCVELWASADFEPCSITEVDSFIIMKNHYLTADIDHSGKVAKLVISCDTDKTNFVPDDRPGNVFALFDDVPLFWDAWDVMDYHLETRIVQNSVSTTPEIKVKTEVCVSVIFSHEIGSNGSRLVQEVILFAHEPFLRFRTKVDWRESHKMLKVEFPANIRPLAGLAVYDTQFGHISRSTGRNSSWDSAKFEVCGQKWASLAEYGRGLAILNDSKYGYSCLDNVLSLSLLRSPKAPDKNCDMSDDHVFEYAIMPYLGSFQQPKFLNDLNVPRCAYELNCPIQMCKPRSHWSIVTPPQSSFRVSNQAIMLEAVKFAENKQNAVVLRLYESFGGKASTVVYSKNRIKEAYLSNILEDLSSTLEIMQDKRSNEDYVNIGFRAFEIKSVIFVYE